MPRTRPPYPPEFRREAIKLVRISSKSQHQVAEDLGISDLTLRNWVKQAERDFRPQAPNLTWSADITYVSTWEGFLYLAHVQDLFSRLIVG